MEGGPGVRAGDCVKVQSYDLGEDVQMVFGIMGDYGERPYLRLESADDMHAIKISGEATDNPNENDYQNMYKISHKDSSRFFKKGAIYHNRTLHRNFKRDTDSSGVPTDEPAHDTLPN